MANSVLVTTALDIFQMVSFMGPPGSSFPTGALTRAVGVTIGVMTRAWLSDPVTILS